MEIERELRNYVESELLDGRVITFTDTSALLAEGTIDSLGLMKMLGFIQRQFHVDLTSVGGPDDFGSIRSLAAAIRRHA